MLSLKKSSQFKKDYKKIKHNKKAIIEFIKIIPILLENKQLPEKYLDHQLKWSMNKYRECHILPDLLLVYEKKENKLIILLLKITNHNNL